ncbi:MULTISPECIES: sensor histidine kinase [Sphingomonas]|uniref:sensor histidine kinase n=1 Tax=Sphingomonas TaxID=13687 RepID=UPI000DEFC386|nr:MULTISPECIES: histidine kinase [Sphingomonas]
MNMLSAVDVTGVGPVRNDDRRFADLGRAIVLIVGFWIAYAITVIARAFLGDDPLTVLENKLITLFAGTVLTFGIYTAVQLFAPGPSLGRKAVVALLGSILAAAALATTLVGTEAYMKSSKEEMRFQTREGFMVIQKGDQIRIERRAADPVVLTPPRINEFSQRDRLRFAADTAVVWLFFFVAWSAFYLASVSQRQALALSRRAAQAESAAQSAQVRALRYQVNPHFLFNTLNSLSSLVMTGRAQEAETMILKLSTFFRTSLSVNPTADVTLAEEIALQRLYLDIEKTRFPRRLKVDIDVPAHLSQTLLPALLLQPVVENAIKYGVSATRDKVTLRIAATEPEPGVMQIEITNSGGVALKSPRARAQPESTGVGLTNVCQRLAVRFGQAASCRFGPSGEGGYRVIMTLPMTCDLAKDG